MSVLGWEWLYGGGVVAMFIAVCAKLEPKGAVEMFAALFAASIWPLILLATLFGRLLD